MLGHPSGAWAASSMAWRGCLLHIAGGECTSTLRWHLHVPALTRAHCAGQWLRFLGALTTFAIGTVPDHDRQKYLAPKRGPDVALSTRQAIGPRSLVNVRELDLNTSHLKLHSPAPAAAVHDLATAAGRQVSESPQAYGLRHCHQNVKRR